MKILKGIWNTIRIAFLVFTAIFVTTVIIQTVTKNEMSMFGFRIFSVQTGSMVPRYNVGDVLISKTIEPKDIRVGDDLVYLGEKGGVKGKTITHEVIGIKQHKDGEVLLRTKGIANPTEDPEFSSEQVYGEIVYRTIGLSMLYKILRTPMGVYILIILPVLGMIGYEIISRMLQKADDKHSKKRAVNKKRVVKKEEFTDLDI